MNLLAFNTFLLVMLIALQQLVVFRDKRTAVLVAQRVAEAATLAAREATQASFTVNNALQRSQALYGEIEQQIGKVLQATIRMERAAGIVAGNLAGDKSRAKDRMHASDYEPGAAADVYAATSEEPGA